MQALLQSTAVYKLLQTQAQADKLSHAYLLLYADEKNLRKACGEFAKLLFLNRGLNEKQEARVCSLIEKERFCDCLVFPEEGKKFAVEHAERIAEECMLMPVEGDRKVFIIADFAEANAVSQNKLLKLLENPPEGVIFLLGATESYSLLSTVLSRVAKLEIPPFTEGDIAAALSRIYGEGYLREDITVCAAACGGNLGVAQDMLEGGGYKTLLDEAYSLALCPLSQLPTLVRKVGETKQKRQLLSMLRIVFRDALVCKIGKGEAAFLQAQRSRTQKIADRFLERALLYAQERLSKAESEVQFNAVFPQCLETLIASVLRENEK